MMRIPVIMLLASAAFTTTADASCPIINGKFTREVGHESLTLTLFTKRDGGLYRYTVAGADDFQVADGKKYPLWINGFEYLLSYECRDSALYRILQKKEDGYSWWRRYRLLNEDEVEITGTDAHFSGIYRRTK